MAPVLPVRTCVGCRGIAWKQTLVRVVRGPGGVEVDASGSAHGRGSYVHADVTCVELAFERHAFERALRTGPAAREAVRLRADLDRLIGAM